MLSVVEVIALVIQQMAGSLFNIVYMPAMMSNMDKFIEMENPDSSSDAFENMMDFYSSIFTPGMIISMIFVYIVIIILSYLVSMFKFKITLDVFDTNIFDVSKSFSSAIKFIKPYLGVCLIIIGVFFALIFIGLGVFFGVGYSSFSNMSSDDFAVMCVVLMIVSLVLLIPVMYFCIRFGYAFYAVFDGYKSLDALKYSWKITSGNVLVLILLGIVSSFIITIGFFVCCVGVIPASAFVYLLSIASYRMMAPKEGTPEIVESQEDDVTDVVM